jgi:hypothetical protein
MIGVKNSLDARSQFQDGWWPIKLPFLLVVAIVTFLLPNSVFDAYGICEHTNLCHTTVNW